LNILYHRVFCTDGGIGGLSALGGTAIKKKMLQFELQGLPIGK